METSNTRNINYSFIAVPTNLFFALDVNLRNALTVLLQLSSVFADQDGYFYRTIEDLQDDFKMGHNLTIAVLESLYQYGLLQVKSVGFTKKNTKKQVNFYRVNFERFKDFEKYHIYTITKNEELHLETVKYREKGFKVTYTASTVEESITSPTINQNSASEEIPSNHTENALERQEMANNDTVEDSEPIETVEESQFELEFTNNCGVDVVEECQKVVEEVNEYNELAEEVEEDNRKLNDKELETRLIQYFNDNKDSITTETQYNEFETVFKMVLQNYKVNDQITFDQFKHANLYILLPKLSELRYKLLQQDEVEKRNLKPSNVETLTIVDVDYNNVTETKEKAKNNNIVQAVENDFGCKFINPIAVDTVVIDTKKEEMEQLYNKCLNRMINLFKTGSNRESIKETYNKIVDGIDTIKNDGKINNIMYNQLKQKAWWLYTDFMSKLL